MLAIQEMLKELRSGKQLHLQVMWKMNAIANGE